MKAAVITSSVLILCLILLRKFCKGRISALIQYALWLIVAVRLIMPGVTVLFPDILPKSNLSIMNAAEELEERIQDALPVYFNLSFTQPGLPMIMGEADGPTAVFVAGKVGGGFWDSVFRNGGQGLWGLGMLVTGLWIIAVNIRFAKRLRAGRKDTGIREKGLLVYAVKDLASPCLYGRPGRQCIYLPEDVLEEAIKDTAGRYTSEETTPENLTAHKKLHHILIHEYCHYKHKDVFWAALRCILVIVYWFHPLVWVAAVLSKRDCELACDETAIRLLGEDERVPYGKTLLELITRKAKASDIACMATTMTANGRSVKERISRIAGNPKKVRMMLAVVVFVIIVISVFTFTQANDIPNGPYLVSTKTGMAVESECFYIDFPKTLSGKIWVTEENDTDILVYDRESGRIIGGFYRMKMADAYNLLEKETIYPVGTYGGNSYLYQDTAIYSKGNEYTGSGGNIGVPGANSNVGVSGTDSNDGVSGTYSNADTIKTEMSGSETTPISGGEMEPLPAPENIDKYVMNLPFTDGQDLEVTNENVTYLSNEEIITEPISEANFETRHNYEPNSTVSETYRYDMGASEFYMEDDGSAAVGMFCYIYRPASYEDAEREEAARLTQINQELIALSGSDSVKVLLMSGAIMEQILERMVEYRTPYVGTSFKVSQLADSVPEAEGLIYRYLEMDTGEQPYGITLHCRMMTDDLADIDQDVCLLDAILLFASIENLDQVTIAITPEWNEESGPVPAQDKAFLTYYRTNQEERFGALYPCSETKEDMINLYQRVKEALEEK